MVRLFASRFALVVAIIAGAVFLLGLMGACSTGSASDTGILFLQGGWWWWTGALALVALAWFYVLRPKR